MTGVQTCALPICFGVNRYPAVVVLRGGAYLGVISGILDWSPFVTELARISALAPSRLRTLNGQS